MGAGEIRAGKAFVEVYTKDSTKGGLDGIKAKLGAFGSQVAKIGGIAVTAATAAITASVMKAVSTGANIQDLADRYAIGTTAIQQLSFAAKMSGTSLEGLIIGIRNMQKGLGGGTLGAELNSIGLSATKLAGLAPEKQFEMIAEAVGGISDPAQRTAIAMKIFGKSGADLIPLLKSGEGGVKALNAEFDKMGVTMSEEAIKEAAAFDDELVKLGVQFDAMVVAIGTKFLPLLKEVTDFASRAMKPTVPEPEGPATDARGAIIPQFRQAFPYQPAEATGNSAVGRFIAGLVAKNREKVFDELQSVLYGIGIGRPQLRNGGIGYVAGMPSGVLGAMTAIQGYLSGSAVARSGGDIASFGTFDKRDIAGGAFLAATNQQLAEAKKQTQLLREIKEKKPGVPWG